VRLLVGRGPCVTSRRSARWQLPDRYETSEWTGAGAGHDPRAQSAGQGDAYETAFGRSGLFTIVEVALFSNF